MKNNFIYLLLLFSSIAFSQIKYKVKAPNGLIVRSLPTTKSEKIRKLEYNEVLTINKISKADTITDNGYKIAGHWVELKDGYIFDGFLRERYTGSRQKKRQQVYGRVKTVKDYNTIYHYKKSKDSLYKGKTDIGHVYKFDKNGNCTEVYSSYGRSDSIKIDYKYEYDKKQNLIKEISYSGDKIYSTETFKYNRKGQKTEENKNTKGKAYYKWMYKYDKKGNKIEEEDYYYDRDRSKRWVIAYNNKNNRVSTDFYDYNQKHKHRVNYSYNTKGELLKRTKKIISTDKELPQEEYIYKDSLGHKIEIHKNYNSEGLLKDETIKTYHKNGKLFKLQEIEKKGRQGELESFLSGPVTNDSRKVKLYDINGETIDNKSFITENGKEIMTIHYKYTPNTMSRISINDSNGNIDLDEYFFDYKGNRIKKLNYYHFKKGEKKRISSTETYSYVFDKRNNWIEKREYRDRILKKIYNRDIIYY